MKTGQATGFQIAFLSLAALLLMVPALKYLDALRAWAGGEMRLVEKALVVLLAAAVIWSFPALRRRAREELSRPIAPHSHPEVAWVLVLKGVVAFGWWGGMVAWWWFSEGPVALEQHVRRLGSHESEMAQALAWSQLVALVAIGAFLGPVLEEIVFRGLLYRAWERQWGWIPAMLMTSVVFGLYHPFFLAAFLGSIVYVCLYRRTGSLLAPILVHGAYNTLVYYPLLGQYLIPRDLPAPGDLRSYGLHLACLVVASVALPFYVWLARARDPDADD